MRILIVEDEKKMAGFPDRGSGGRHAVTSLMTVKKDGNMR